MCKIKTGAQIQEMTDVQNLVTAYILRSRQPYSIPALSKKIMRSCKGSSIPISDAEVTNLVKDTTIALLRSDYITSNSGHYYARPVAYK